MNRDRDIAQSIIVFIICGFLCAISVVLMAHSK